ncbi:MAG: hypothetical protein COA79_11875 [Planctomycetota bacterium]|nr:MAG: hypothetical protein COA79_11875 [Planctomycetota bacterium]
MTNSVNLQTRLENDRLQIVNAQSNKPILVQHASENRRPYIHPIVAPHGHGVLTENEPGHHLWQHGLYTGLHGVNDMDFWTEGLSANGLKADGTFHPEPIDLINHDMNHVIWEVNTIWRSRTEEDMLLEKQTWNFQAFEEHYYLDLEWELKALIDIEFAQCAYGGLFLRMPYRAEIGASFENSEGLKFKEADSTKAQWGSVSMPTSDSSSAGIAIMDHPSNPAFPTPWRVDSGYGLSPSPCINGKRILKKSNSSKETYRLYIYEGDVDVEKINKEYDYFTQSMRSLT